MLDGMTLGRKEQHLNNSLRNTDFKKTFYLELYCGFLVWFQFLAANSILPSV